jgi:uncharacterized membrane protein
VNATTHPLVERYLRDLREALRDLPRRQRDELVAEIASHIEQTLPPDASDAEVLTALDRMGEPEQIAGAERERLGVEQPTSGWLEWLAIPLLLLGGIVIPGVGWVIGLVFLWLSRAWTVRDKTLATLLVPGGLLPALILVALPTHVETCSTSSGVRNGLPWTATHCTGGQSTAATIALIALFVFLAAAPIYTAVRLGRRLPPARRPKLRARLTGRQALGLFIFGIALGGSVVWYYLSTRPPGG